MSFINSIFNFLRFNRKNWKAVALCVFAATVFWFFNALNKNYTTNISLPLTFDYNQENYVAVRPLPEAIRINVTGVGWNLFRRSIGLKVSPLAIPLERPSEIRKIVGSTLPALLANQLDGYQVNFVLTDTLHLALEPKGKRWVSLQLDLPSILFRKGYVMSSDPKVVPDSIFVEGPWKLINNLAEPVSLKVAERDIDDDFSEDLEVGFLNSELVRRDPPTVHVSFNVDRLVEVKDSIDLKVQNMPKGVWPSIEGRLPVVFAIPEALLAHYHRDSVHAVIDLHGFERGEKKVLPYIEGLPPYSRIIKVDSVSVKF
ncbi:MAG TPA: hypothetical protein VD816_01735 [Ohtaekwangia sp.]|nr:hypothetical protein [Ohtaekwangia sp.]